MATPKPFLLGAPVVLVSLTTGTPARADQPGTPFSYQHVTSGGKYVFVMLAPEWSDRARYSTAGRDIRRTYPRSGLYRNDNSTSPLWTVDWYAFESEVKVAPDGVHLVRGGPWATNPNLMAPPPRSALDQEAVSFFSNGQLVRTYQIHDLVNEPGKMHATASHFWWKESDRFDEVRLEYTVATLDGNRFTFDARTGAIIAESRSKAAGGAIGQTALAVLAVIGVIVAIEIVWKLSRKVAAKPS